MPLNQQMPIIYQSCLCSLSCGVLEHCLNWMIGKRYCYVEHDSHQSFCDLLFIYYLFILLVCTQRTKDSDRPQAELSAVFFQSLVLWIGHFRVPSGLCLKTRLSAQSLIWKWFFIRMQTKFIFTRKVVHSASFWKWGFLELGSGLL